MGREGKGGREGGSSSPYHERQNIERFHELTRSEYPTVAIPWQVS